MRQLFTKFIFLSAILISPLSLLGKINVIVTLNLAQCNSCTNHLSLLKSLDSSINIAYVMQSKYQIDSADVAESFGLEGEMNNIIWSDSLYRQTISPVGFSVVRAINTSTGKSYNFLLNSNFDKGIIDFINRLNSEESNFKIEKRGLTSGVETIDNKEGLLYILDGFRNEIRIFNIASGKQLSAIQVTDSISKEVFMLKFKDIDVWNENNKMIKKLGLKRYQSICHFQPDKNNLVHVTIEHKLVIKNNPDTIVLSLYSLETFTNKGELVKCRVINHIEFEDKNLLSLRAADVLFDTTGFTIDPYIFNYKDSVVLIGLQSKSRQTKEKYFLGEFHIGKDDIIRFNKPVDLLLPSVYDPFGYHFADVKFSHDGQYCTLGLDDEILGLEYPYEKIKTGFIKKSQYRGTIFNYAYYLMNFEISEDFAYLLYWDIDENEVFYLKFDRHEKKIINSKRVDYKNKALGEFIMIDNFDYNYLYIPSERNRLERRKFF